MTPGRFNLGLDIDGTITAHPRHFAQLALACRRGGGKIHVVSSRSPEGRRETLQELRQLGICFDALWLLPDVLAAQESCPHGRLSWYQRFVWQKIDYALENGLALFYDDDPVVIDLFGQFAPDIVVNRDWPK